MASNFVHGQEVLGRLLDALGLKDQAVKRLVLVVDCDSAVEVFVQKYVYDDEIDALADTIERFQRTEVHQVTSIEVDEKGRAFVPASEYAKVKRELEEMEKENPHWRALRHLRDLKKEKVTP